MPQIIDQDWLKEPNLQSLLVLLSNGDGEARIAGGAVRNALMGQPISDVDVATNLVPRDVILRLSSAGHKSVPTGIAHGTVTAVIGGDTYEVTTLRSDIETDGRHAKVLYGTDWETDARRRDLTINALYLTVEGHVIDPLGGLPDVFSRTVRFIDDAEMRIKEDYLRILRFFRFFAWYGKFRPDADGLRACAKLKDGLAYLSVERVWQELAKLLAAPDPGRAILWMRQTGVLTKVLPETEKWGIDALSGLITAEQKHGWKVDSLLRLMSILPPNREKVSAMAKRLKLPNSVRDRLLSWADTETSQALLNEADFLKWLYWQDEMAVKDRLQIAVAADGPNAKKHLRQIKWLSRWDRPTFPVRGQDLLDDGMKPGPSVAEMLQKLERDWVESGFKLNREELLGVGG